jgi:hypothetical protein
MGGFFHNAPRWSPVEEEYLKQNRNNVSIDQLCQALAKSRNAIKKKIALLDGKSLPEDKRKAMQGFRKDIGLYVRSGWEANVIRWLNHKRITWLYEPKVFFFDGIKTGTNTYCPDLYLPELDTWLEIKGQIIGQAKTAIRRFKRFYPKDFGHLVAITGSPSTQASKFFQEMKIPIMAFYNDLNKEFKSLLANWE